MLKLWIKPPVRTREGGYRIAEHASRAFLPPCIRKTYLKKQEFSSRIDSLQGRLGTKLSMADYQKVMSLSYRAAEKTHETKKDTDTKVGEAGQPESLERWVVNLTDRTLTPAQEDVFVPAFSKLPLADTMAAVESGARRSSPEDADDLQGWVCGILRHAKVPRSNLTRDEGCDVLG